MWWRLLCIALIDLMALPSYADQALGTPNKTAVGIQGAGSCLIFTPVGSVLSARVAGHDGPLPSADLGVLADKLHNHLGQMSLRLVRIYGLNPEWQPAYFYTQIPVQIAQIGPASLRPESKLALALSQEFVDTQLTSSNRGGLALFGFLAHEFGHAFQYQNGYITIQSPPHETRAIELHADFLAGWALARDSDYRYAPADIDVFAEQLFFGGDLQFWQRDHHGMPTERYTMMMRGFLRGQSRPDEPAAEAAKAGWQLVTGLTTPAALRAQLCSDQADTSTHSEVTGQ